MANPEIRAHPVPDGVVSRWLTGRYRPLVVFAALHLAVWLLTRLTLLVVHRFWQANALGDTLQALVVGEIFDITSALWMGAPLALYLTLVSDRWSARVSHRIILDLWLGAAAYLALFTAAAEYFFFDEFDSRFNFVAVDYLLYPTEVVNNIWESYPTGWILAGLAVLTAGFVFWMRRDRRRWAGRTHRLGGVPARHRGLAVAGYAVTLALLSTTLHPGWAHISADRALNEIASNGPYAFWQALLGADAPYAGLYAHRDESMTLGRVRALLREPSLVPGSFAAGSIERSIRPPAPAKPLNVVVVLEESLGSEFVGALHPEGPAVTPEFDALTREGALWTHAYSTGNRTIRALETTTASIPPLPGSSIVRRDQSHDLFTLPALLRDRGYSTLFVYGGRALFDGMGSYMRANGVDRIVDQSDFPDGTFTTAWGACDEAIFERSIAEMDAMAATGRPFYTLILSVSNHRPYTFPTTGIQPLPGLRRRENAVRYADYALGKFVREARRHPFFDHTVFVLMGDHGARVYGAAEIPLASYEVPILFLAPGLAPPGGVRIDTVASSMDLPPSILGLLGQEYRSKFFGQDVFSIAPAQGRAVMNHNNEIALLRGDRLAILGLHEQTALYALREGRNLERIEALDAAGSALLDDAISLYSVADDIYRSGGYGAVAPRSALLSEPPPPSPAAGPSATGL